jgi:hypothetical protein
MGKVRMLANPDNLERMYKFYREKKKESVEFTFQGNACEITLGKPPVIKKLSSELVEKDLFALEKVLVDEDRDAFFRSSECIVHPKVLGNVTWPVVLKEEKEPLQDSEWARKARKYLEIREKASEGASFLFDALSNLDELHVNPGDGYLLPLEFLLPRNYEVEEKGSEILITRKVGKESKAVCLLTKHLSPDEVVRNIARYNVPSAQDNQSLTSLHIFHKGYFENFLRGFRRKLKRKLSEVKTKEKNEVLEEKLTSLNYAMRLLRPSLRILQPCNVYYFGATNYLNLTSSRVEAYRSEIKIPRWAKILAGIGVIAAVGGWALRLYVDQRMREERIKPLLSIGYSEDEAMYFDYKYKHWAVNNQYNSSVLKFAENLKNYPETSLALLDSTNSLKKVNHSFNYLMPYLQNGTFSDEQIASFIHSYSFLAEDGIDATDVSAIKYRMKFPDLFDKIVENFPFLLAQPNLMKGDYDKDGFSDHEELTLGFNPTNSQEKIFLPVKNDTALMEYIPRFHEYKGGVATVLSSVARRNFEKIVNGCLGFDSNLEALGLNRSEIARIYRINTVASGYLNLDSSFPLFGINLDKYCLKNYGKFEPSNDLTLVDKIIQLYVANKRPDLPDKNRWKFVSIADCLGFWALPPINPPPYSITDKSIITNVNSQVHLNALLDVRFNETSYRPSLSSWERENLIPTFDYLWKVFPENDPYARFVCQTTTPGLLMMTGVGFPPTLGSGAGKISALNNTDLSHWSDVGFDLGFMAVAKIFDQINSTNPGLLHDYYGPSDFVNEHYGLDVWGCQFVSTLNTKIFESKGIPIINYYEMWKYPDGRVTAHLGVVYKINDELVYDPKRIGGDPNFPYWINPEDTKKIFSQWDWELKKIYVFDVSRERNPFILLYENQD